MQHVFKAQGGRVYQAFMSLSCQPDLHMIAVTRLTVRGAAYLLHVQVDAVELCMCKCLLLNHAFCML